MTRLHGERVTLVPVPHAVAVAVVDAADPTGPPVDLDEALRPLRAGAGWPHADTADALRPHAEHGGPGRADGTFLVVVDGEVVGDCGWTGVDADGDAEIGYGLAPAARGRGLGLETVAVLCAWVERQPGVRRVVAEALVGNEPSRRLLLRLGFAEIPGGAAPYVRYGRPTG